VGIAADFVLIIVAGFLGGLLARLLRLPLLVGYVAAGVAVGPYTAGPRVTELHDIELLAEIGVALLLFSIGLEISIRDLQPVRRIAVFGGPIQILATAGAGAAIGIWGLGMAPVEAIWFSSMTSVSSTMVVLKTLAAEGLTTTLASRVMIGLLVVQDLAVIPMLVVLPALGAPEGLAWKLTKAMGIAVVFLAAIVFIGTRLLPRILRQVLRWGARELFLVCVVAISVGIGYATTAIGLPFALGAFVAGLILSESEFSHQALSDVVPLRDIFGLLFFVSVGMLFDPMYAMSNAATIAIVVASIFTGKALLIGGLTWAFSYRNMAPWIVGLGLSQIGEFSFVLARTGFSSGLISKGVYDLSLSCTVLTMALSPLVSGLALPLGRAWRRWKKPSPVQREFALPPVRFEDHVIIAGFGRTGRAAARAFVAAGIPVLVVESNLDSMTDIANAGCTGIWGDIERDEILRAARIDGAKVLMLTMPNRNTIHVAIERARNASPSIQIVARALRDWHVEELRAEHVIAIQPEFEGGVEMVRQALEHFGRDSEGVETITAQLRRELYGDAVSGEI
jgi:CPA2 family monovalent cation:H+ antiporter-2